MQTKSSKKPQSLGLYIHVPFCPSSCEFCAFYQIQPKRSQIEAYLDQIELQLEQFNRENEQGFASADPLSPSEDFSGPFSVFFGGGTPGMLSAKDLSRLCEATLKALPCPPSEWTVELTPSSVKAEKLKVLREFGVNRISMGAQNFDAAELEKIGRRQNNIEAAIDTLRDSGATNLNLDLMFALPEQSLKDWEKQLNQALAHQPEHLSTYCLSFEADTQLWLKLKQGKVRPHSPEAEAEFFELTWQVLKDAGYQSYEIANHAREGYACQHNLNTWNMGAWRGLGPSAASQWRGWRFQEIPDLETWLKQSIQPASPPQSQNTSPAAPPQSQNTSPASPPQFPPANSPKTQADTSGFSPPEGAIEITQLSQQLLATDRLIFGLRTFEGVDLKATQQRFPKADLAPCEPLWQQLEHGGQLKRKGARIALSTQGRLIADAIGRGILECIPTP